MIVQSWLRNLEALFLYRRKKTVFERYCNANNPLRPKTAHFNKHNFPFSSTCVNVWHHWSIDVGSDRWMVFSQHDVVHSGQFSSEMTIIFMFFLHLILHKFQQASRSILGLLDPTLYWQAALVFRNATQLRLKYRLNNGSRSSTRIDNARLFTSLATTETEINTNKLIKFCLHFAVRTPTIYIYLNP